MSKFINENMILILSILCLMFIVMVSSITFIEYKRERIKKERIRQERKESLIRAKSQLVENIERYDNLYRKQPDTTKFGFDAVYSPYTAELYNYATDTYPDKEFLVYSTRISSINAIVWLYDDEYDVLTDPTGRIFLDELIFPPQEDMRENNGNR